MIDGYFDRRRRPPCPMLYVRMAVNGAGHTWEGTVPLLVDTGSEITSLTAVDALLGCDLRQHFQLRIDFNGGMRGLWDSPPRQRR